MSMLRAKGTETVCADAPGYMDVVRTSLFTKKEHAMRLQATPEQFAAWYGGELIHKAFPLLTADEREFLLTGTTAEEWNAAFPPEEDVD